MTPLYLIVSPTSSTNPLEANLHWDTTPNKVWLCFWNEEYWGQATAESEEIPVNTQVIAINAETIPIISIQLQDENYICKVIAECGYNKKHGGTAHYSFYTIRA